MESYEYPGTNDVSPEGYIDEISWYTTTAKVNKA